MADRIFNGDLLSKKQFEWVTWFTKGTDDWWEAYGQYEARRASKRTFNDTYYLSAKTWFNKVLLSLHKRDLFTYVPFAWTKEEGIPFVWKHPGFPDSSELEAITLHLQADEYAEFRKPLL